MDFQPGDIQFLKNASILHKRTAYEICCGSGWCRRPSLRATRACGRA